jgi:ribosomal protein L32
MPIVSHRVCTNPECGSYKGRQVIISSD